MAERPIIFSTAMSAAILDGRKTQTRRILSPQPRVVDSSGRWYRMPNGGQSLNCFSAYCAIGDRLWVRERFSVGLITDGRCAGNSFVHFVDGGQKYRDGAYYSPANHGGKFDQSRHKWKPSIHMPRWAARTWLEVTDVAIEHLQSITYISAIAEGVAYEKGIDDPRIEFHRLWDSLNYERAPWDSNPFVWAITFKRLTP